MSQVGLLLDGVLILLLVMALVYGLKLEKKLKALRDGQTGFAKAVAELNGAAIRAEQGLGALRQAAAETEELHGRVTAARVLKVELETLIARAERLGAQPRPAASQPPPRPAPRPEASAPTLAETAAPAPGLDRATILQALANAREVQTRFEAGERTPPSRPRPPADEDLFEAPARRAL